MSESELSEIAILRELAVQECRMGDYIFFVHRKRNHLDGF